MQEHQEFVILGETVIRRCIEEGIPGACAFVNSLVCSGLNTETFLFLGFLPLNKKNRKHKNNDNFGYSSFGFFASR